MSNKKLSVIIPVYNVEKYLRQCLDSVINQTLKEIEIICIDDGSTDDSLKILKEYAAKDSRIYILKQENMHAGVARNKGLEIAKGEYVHFLDSDDWINVNAYKQLYEIIQNTNADMVKFKSYLYDNETDELTLRQYSPNLKWENYLSIYKDTKNILLLQDTPWSAIYNTNFLKKNYIYFDNFVCANDVGFFYRCIINAQKVYLSSKRFVYHRVNLKNSLINRRIENFNCQTALYDVVKN